MKDDSYDILKALYTGQNIAIAGHINPDGDAIGACMALAICLEKIGKRPLVLLEEYSQRFACIPGGWFVYKDDISKLGTDAHPIDTFIVLDCAGVSRLGAAGQLLDRVSETVCIDHHMGTEAFAKLNLLDDKASSTCQMVFGIINQLAAIDSDIASALYAGIVYDTGGFRHINTSPETMDIAAKLMALGIPFTDIYNEIMFVRSEPETRAFAKALANLCVDDQCPIACLHISLKEIDSVGANPNDLDGIVQYGINMRGMEACIFVYEQEEGALKVSLRSKRADMCGVARCFGGGGHRLAAGFSFNGTIDQAFDAALPIVRDAVNEDV